jgi:hypothetical protein
MQVVAAAVLYSHHNGLKKWFILQARKGSMTLRCTAKEEKASPIIVYHEGTQNGQIRKFLEREELIGMIVHELSEPDDLTRARCRS